MNAVARTPASTDDPLAASYQMAAREGKFLRETQGGSATLTGTILDSQGAIVPGARIKLVNQATRSEQESVSNNEGIYRFDSLESGTYALKVDAPGFAGFEMKDITLPSGEESHVNAILSIGAFTMGDVAIVEPSEPLVKAAYENNLAAVKKLLASGADVDVVDKAIDSTALAQATANNNRELMRVLLHAGADINRRNRNGETALMYLSGQSGTDTVRDLIQAGADLELKDDDGETALMAAARLDNTGSLKALIDAGAQIEVKDEEGQTALMLAAREGLADNVRALLAAGAQINSRDENDWTALRHAREGSHEEVMKLLRDRGGIE
jgi:DNA-binding NarL/FixJ family response regulator